MASTTCIFIILLTTVSINYIYTENPPSSSTKKENLRIELITNPQTAHTTAACSFRRRPGEVSLKFRVYTDEIIHSTTYIHVRDLKTGRKIGFVNEHCHQEKRNGNSTTQIIGCFAWEVIGHKHNYRSLYDGNETRKYQVWLTRGQDPDSTRIWKSHEPFDLARNIFGCTRHSMKKIKLKNEQLNSVELVWVMWPQTWLFKPKFKVFINDKISDKPYKCDRKCRQTLYDIKPDKEYNLCVRIEYEFNFLSKYFPTLPGNHKCITKHKNGTREGPTTPKPKFVLDRQENQILLGSVAAVVFFILCIGVFTYMCRQQNRNREITEDHDVVVPRPKYKAEAPKDSNTQEPEYSKIQDPQVDNEPNKNNQIEPKDSVKTRTVSEVFIEDHTEEDSSVMMMGYNRKSLNQQTSRAMS